MMIKKVKLLVAIILLLGTGIYAQQVYPTFSKTLDNGLKVVVCEKPGGNFVQTEVWYRVGSKNEVDGIRGMAHLFEHMMFRGTDKFPGDTLWKSVRKVGGYLNAYTTLDRTVYHQNIPKNYLSNMLEMEADRMDKFKVTQEILDIEREVVGEELLLGNNNWYSKAISKRYEGLHPKDHPYSVDIIGYLEEIRKFTAEQCRAFHNDFYSPNNAFVLVVGDVKHEEVFTICQKYFGPITKQRTIKEADSLPNLFDHKVVEEKIELGYPLQIYGFTYPRPAVASEDVFALNMFVDLMFSTENSILNQRLVKIDQPLASVIISNSSAWSMYPTTGVIDIVMDARPGNARVKKIVRAELDSAAVNGVDPQLMNDYIEALSAKLMLGSYTAENVASQLGMAEFYFNDVNVAFKEVVYYKAVTMEDIKRVAAKYFSLDKVRVINMLPPQ